MSEPEPSIAVVGHRGRPIKPHELGDAGGSLTSPTDEGQPVHLQARALLAQLHQLASKDSWNRQPAWVEHRDRLEELAQFLESGGAGPPIKGFRPAVSRGQWVHFGKLLRDKRNAAGLSRVQLARKAKLSDATIKFVETARHPPSRATLIRLLGVSELNLTWAAVPGSPREPAREPGGEVVERADDSRLLDPFNCFLAPSYDPMALVAELARFLNGAGGYVEQTSAYLEHYSAAAYLALCHHSLILAGLRSHLPLLEMAKRIVTTCGRGKLQVIALGAGDGISETNLVGHLIEAGAHYVELCLLDISQPLLAGAYRHAIELLGNLPSVHVWGIQGNFHHLPLYTVLHRPPARRHRRLFTMLGGTLAHLDHEPRFLQQSLLDCQVDDLLLLDVPLAAASCNDTLEIKRRDRLFSQGVPAPYAAWLGGPIWRHCQHIDRVDFHWNLETHCPVPGSYALHAVATVKSSQRADRQFSMFRFGRYDPSKLAECLRSLGWQEIGASVYGGEHSLRLYCKRDGGKAQHPYESGILA